MAPKLFECPYSYNPKNQSKSPIFLNFQLVVKWAYTGRKYNLLIPIGIVFYGESGSDTRLVDFRPRIFQHQQRHIVTTCCVNLFLGLSVARYMYKAMYVALSLSIYIHMCISLLVPTDPTCSLLLPLGSTRINTGT